MRRQPFPELRRPTEEKIRRQPVQHDVGPGSLLPAGSFEEKRTERSDARPELCSSVTVLCYVLPVADQPHGRAVVVCAKNPDAGDRRTEQGVCAGVVGDGRTRRLARAGGLGQGGQGRLLLCMRVGSPAWARSSSAGGRDIDTELRTLDNFPPDGIGRVWDRTSTVELPRIS